MLKSLKKFLIFVLIVPLMFAVTACKNKKDNSDNKGPQTEQGGGGDPSDPQDPVDPENAVYTVKFDYNLPERLEGLIPDSTKTANVGTETSLPTISNSKAAQYFLGWYDKDNQKVENNISANEDETIELKAKWATGLNKYYYSDGLTFVVNTTNKFAIITGYTGSDEVVYLPIYYPYGSLDYLVKNIGASAFEESSVKKVKFDIEGLVVEQKAFKNSSLEEFDFDFVYELRDECFYGTKLTSVELGNYLQVLGVSVFNSCKDLVSADFSSIDIATVKTIQAMTFYDCSKLTTVKLNNKITIIDSNAFARCVALADFSFIEESNVTDISSYAFDGCTALKEVTLPYRINNLGYEVFRGCTGIEKINLGNIHYSQLGDSLSTYLGDLTETLKEVVLVGNYIQNIPTYYFYQYANLTHFTMSDSVETIGTGAFGGCTSLANLKLSSNLDVEKFDVSTISDTVWYNSLTECLIIDNVLLIAPTSITGEITIAEGVTKISAYAFKDNTGITKVNLPSTIEIIGKNAFYGCSALETVVFAENNKLEAINEYTFYGCSAITSINLTNCKALKTIEGYAFRNALLVDNFELPETIENIGVQAFRNAKIKAFVIAENDKYVVNEGVLYEQDAEGKLVTIVAYPKLKTESTFVVAETVTKIEDYAFNNARNVKTVYILSTNSGVQQNSFNAAGANGFLDIYTEDLSVLNYSPLTTIYRLADSEDYLVVDEETYEIELAETNGLVEGNYFAKIDNGTDIVLVRFTTIVSGETLAVSYQKVVEEIFEI